MYSIVPATRNQIYEMERLVRACLGDELVSFQREFYEWIFETDAVQAFVALQGGQEEDKEKKVVGCVIGIAQQDAKGARFGHVKVICVDRTHRRKAVATRLMLEIEHWFHSFGAQYSALHAKKKDRNAMQFYCKLDYGNSKVIKKYYRNKQDAILFKKPLAVQRTVDI